MKVALIGSSGFVGKHLLNELLNRGHQVTAVTSKPFDTEAREGLTLVQADAYKEDELASVVKGNDVVVSAFNAGWQNPNLYDDFLKGSKSIQAATKQADVERLIVVGGAGSLFINGHQLVDSPEFPAEWKAGATAARDYLNELQNEKELNWVFVSPSIEMHPGTSGVRKGEYRLGGDSPVFDENGKSVISVEDLSVAIVDEVEQEKHSRQRFTVAY